MADAFRGLTLRLGADARPVVSAINSVNASAGQAQKQLNALKKALRFDAGNVRALSASLDLAGDKTRLTARAASLLGTAMKQAARESVKFSAESGIAGGKMDRVAASVKDVYAQTQKIRAERTHVNADLQHMYDAMKQVVSEAYRGENAFKLNGERVKKIEESLKKAGAEGKNSAMVADRYVKILQGDTAKYRAEIDRLIRSAASAKGNPLAKTFGLESHVTAGNQLVGVFTRLHRESGRLKSDLEAIKKVEGFRAMRNQLIAYESAVREASYEEARLLAEHAKMASAPGIGEMTFKMKRLDDAIEAACSDARKMDAAFAALPKSVEAARSKLVASRNAQVALVEKSNELRAAIKKIEEANPLAKVAAQSSNVHLAFEKATRDAAELTAEMRAAEAAVERLERESREYANTSYIGPHRSIEQVNEELKKEQANLAEVSTRAHAANEALESASAAHHVASLNSELAETTTRLSNLQAKSNALAGLAGNLRTTGYGLYSTVTPAILMAGRYAVQAANDVDSAYRDMRKTVNGTEEEFEHLRQAALEFSRSHVTSADQILEIEAIGGQLGVMSKNLESFSVVVSNLDIATNMDTETISENLGQLSNIMKDMNQDLESGPGSLEAFSDSLVRLGNNSAAQEDKIMNVMMRIASMGTISGMATPDLLALSTAVAAAGQGSEAAGTAISKTFSQIESAVGKGGDKLDKFAEVADMSSAEFAEAWGDRPMEAFTAFIKGLKRIDDEGGSVSNTLGELSINGVRQRQTLMNLTNTTEVLNNALVMSNDAWNGVGDQWGAAGDAAREAQRKSEGFSGQLQMMKNAAQELGVSLLDSAVPMLKDLTGTFQALSAAVSNMPDFGKSLLVRAGVVTAALGPLLVGFGATIDGAKKLGEAFETLKGTWMMRGVKKTFLAEVDAALAANQASLDKVSAAQKRHVAALGEESAALKAHKAQLESDRAALEADKAAYNAAAASATKFKTALKGIGLAAGFMVAVEAVSMLVSAISEAIERQQELDKATRGLEAAAQDFTSAANAQADSTKEATSATVDYSDAVNDAIDSNIQLADTIKANKDAAEASSSLAQSYADKIRELSENFDGSAESLALLRTYVSAFNQIAGTSIEVIDEKTGALNVENDVIQKNVDLLKKQAYAEAARKNLEEANKTLIEQESTLNSLYEKRDEIERGEGERWMTNGHFDELRAVNEQIAEMESTIDSARRVAKSAEEQFDQASVDASKQLGQVESSASDASAGMSQLGDEAEEASDELEEIAETIDSLAASYPEFARVLNLDDAGLSVKQFSDLLTEMGLSMEDVSKGVEEMADKVSDGFNQIEVDSEMSLQKYLENLQHNKEVTAAWGDNLKALYDKSSDETYRAWVNEIAEAGPEYAALVADMAGQDAAALEEEARAWQDAKDKGVDAYLSSVGLTSDETQREIREMVDKTKSTLGELDGMNVEYYVDDGGTVHVNLEKLEEFDREGLAEKGFIVTDGGTLLDMTKECGRFDLVKVNDKHYYVTDDGTIYTEQGKVVDLNKDLGGIPSKITTFFEGDDTALRHVVDRVKAKIQEAKQAGAKAGGVVENAAGGILPAYAAGAVSRRALRSVPANASGALNGIVARPTLTNIGWTGEAGAEAILHMRNAGGAVIPLSNRRYVRPFARAVASEIPAGQAVQPMTVQINGTTINRDAEIQASFDAFMNTLARKGAM